MDQLKAILTQFKKYHLWIFCGIIVVLPIAVSLAVSGQLSKNITTRKGELEGAYNSVANLEKAPNPPNEKTKQVITERHQKLVDNVNDAWKLFYDQQPTKAANWPTELGQEFLSRIALLKPNDPIEDRDREAYLYFINKHIPALMLKDLRTLPDGRVLYMFQMPAAERDAYMKSAGIRKADVKPVAKPDPKAPAAKTDSAPAAAAAMAGDHDEPQGIIKWYSSQQDLYSPSTAIGPLLDAKRRPTSSQIWLAQEDLWVIEALLRILEKTNEGATSTYNAPVKTILSLKIGLDAATEMAKSQERVIRLGMASSGPAALGPAAKPASVAKPAAGGGGSVGDADAPTLSGAPGAAGGAGQSEDEQMRRNLTNNRYVDQNGLPLRFGTNAPFAEFKMMPVYMELVVDQRAVPKVLVECANSNMPVIVRRVAIRPEENKPLELAGLISSARGGGSDAAPGASRSGTARGPAGGGGDAFGRGRPVRGGPGGGDAGGVRASTTESSSDEMVVQIQGIIYIFNRPQKELIGTGAATGPPQPGAPPGGGAGSTAPAPTGQKLPAPTPAGVAPPGPTTPPPAPTGAAPPGPTTPAPAPPAGPPLKGGAPAKT
jgi:hypothetical protein